MRRLIQSTPYFTNVTDFKRVFRFWIHSWKISPFSHGITIFAMLFEEPCCIKRS